MKRFSLPIPKPESFEAVGQNFDYLVSFFQPPEWLPITPLLDTWVIWSPGFEPEYCIDALGVLRCRGAIKDGALAVDAFQLPAPEKLVQRPVATDTGYGMVQVFDTGLVIVESGGTGAVDLANVEYLVA